MLSVRLLSKALISPHILCMNVERELLEARREITSVCQVVISKTFAPKKVAMSYSGRPLSFVELL